MQESFLVTGSALPWWQNQQGREGAGLGGGGGAEGFGGAWSLWGEGAVGSTAEQTGPTEKATDRPSGLGQ